MAAKEAALSYEPRLESKRVTYNGRQVGFVVTLQGQTVGHGKLAREAWSDAYFNVGGTFPVCAKRP